MEYLDKFHSVNFNNGFETHNSILDVTPYQPEVIFIGTHNHGWSWNNADFFYGRGMYMWTILGNLFLFNKNNLRLPRSTRNLTPSIQQVFEICKKGKIGFANIVSGVKEGIPVIDNYEARYVLVNDEYKWGKVNGSRIGEYADEHLEHLGKKGYLEDNLEPILNFLSENKTIKHVYFTFNSGSWLLKRSKTIRQSLRKDISCCSIFTPTGKGFGKLLSEPFNCRAWGISHCWVWNGMSHNIPINKLNYGHLDHDWLYKNGVTPDHF